MDGQGEGLQLEKPGFQDKDRKVLMSAANIKKLDFYTVLKAKQKSHDLMGLSNASATPNRSVAAVLYSTLTSPLN